jgi:hypothetical protein
MNIDEFETSMQTMILLQKLTLKHQKLKKCINHLKVVGHVAPLKRSTSPTKYIKYASLGFSAFMYYKRLLAEREANANKKLIEEIKTTFGSSQSLDTLVPELKKTLNEQKEMSTLLNEKKGETLQEKIQNVIKNCNDANSVVEANLKLQDFKTKLEELINTRGWNIEVPTLN